MKDAKSREGLRSKESGFTLLEALVVLGLLALILAFVAYLYPRLSGATKADEFVKELTTIRNGLATYYQANYRFPRGTGWGWNTNNAYIPPAIPQKGWQYSCSGSTITITTPAIAGADVRTKVRDSFNTMCDGGASISGSSVVCTLNNKPCP